MSSKKLSECRKWNLTINNPIEKGWNHEKLNNTLQSIATILYFCLADEIGDEENTYHTHLYFVCKNPKSFNTVKNFFPEAHIEAAIGLSIQNKNYVFKEGNKYNKSIDTGKYIYLDSKGKQHSGIHYDSTNLEWGEMPVEKQGQRTDMLMLFDMIKDGYSNVQIMDENPTYMLHLDKIEKARQNYRESIYRGQRRLNLHCTYIWGVTGAGKTRYVMDKYGDVNVYRVTDYNHPFDRYNGEKVLLFEEFRSSLRLSDMLSYIDVYYMDLPARYCNKVACYEEVYICTNIDLREQYPFQQKCENTSWQAFLRRINNVMVFTGDKVIDLDTQKYLKECFPFLKYNGETPFDRKGGVDNE